MTATVQPMTIPGVISSGKGENSEGSTGDFGDFAAVLIAENAAQHQHPKTPKATVDVTAPAEQETAADTITEAVEPDSKRGPKGDGQDPAQPAIPADTRAAGKATEPDRVTTGAAAKRSRESIPEIAFSARQAPRNSLSQPGHSSRGDSPSRPAELTNAALRGQQERVKSPEELPSHPQRPRAPDVDTPRPAKQDALPAGRLETAMQVTLANPAHRRATEALAKAAAAPQASPRAPADLAKGIRLAKSDRAPQLTHPPQAAEAPQLPKSSALMSKPVTTAEKPAAGLSAAKLEESEAVPPLRGGEGPQSAPQSASRAIAQTGPGAMPPEVAKHVAGQIAVAVTPLKPGVTEVALNPQELGRVRLTLSAQDSALILHITAERPETADAMRRHIDVLGQEFRELGYRDIQFSFGNGEGQDRPAQDNAADDGVAMPEADHDNAVMPTLAQTVATTGLDLRL